MARTTVRRDIDQSVARHHAVLARSARPMVTVSLARSYIDQLDTVAAQNQVFRCRFVAVTAVVAHDDPEMLLIGRAGSPYIPRV